MKMDCRLCTRNSADCKPLTPNLIKIVQKLLPIVVLNGDRLPKDICMECDDKLNCFSSFYEETKRADIFWRKQLPFTSLDATPVTDPFLYFYDIHEQLTAAYKPFMKKTEKDESFSNFIRKTIDKTTLFCCKSCKRTYLSESAALRHECDEKISEKLVSHAKYSSSPRSNDNAECNNEISSNDSPNDQRFLRGQKSNNATLDQNLEPTDIILICEKSTEKKNEEIPLSNANVNVLVDLPQTNKRNCDRIGDDFYFAKKKSKKRKRAKADDSEILYCCNECGKGFVYPAELTIHSQIHSPSILIVEAASASEPAMHPTEEMANDKRHVCTICKLSFTRKTTLLAHEQNHITKSLVTEWSDDDVYVESKS